ncbi:inositol monophosphatase [Bartonella sp. DGB1]|uniref:inositol monophosphatase family protein n=1 Tax=Bartonella sp. DGB1 TaxID=3239807 RepID=UPI0035247F73
MRENLLFLQKELALLKEVVIEAGNIAKSCFGTDLTVSFKEENSPVTNVDIEVDNYLKKTLLTNRPNYGWISEESNDDRKLQKQPEYYFVVDPIDGTRGFIAGANNWTISIALANDDGIPLVGVLYCPMLDKCYEAIINHGAFLNSEPIAKLTDKKLQDKLIFSVSPAMLKKIDLSLNNIELGEDIASLAYRIALLVEAKIDCVIVRPNCNDWDIMAIDLILQEVGGKIADLNGEKVNYMQANKKHDLLVVSRNSLIHDLIKLIKHEIK